MSLPLVVRKTTAPVELNPLVVLTVPTVKAALLYKFTLPMLLADIVTI